MELLQTKFKQLKKQQHNLQKIHIFPICELGDTSDEAESECVDGIVNRIEEAFENAIKSLIDRLNIINKEKNPCKSCKSKRQKTYLPEMSFIVLLSQK